MLDDLDVGDGDAVEKIDVVEGAAVNVRERKKGDGDIVRWIEFEVVRRESVTLEQKFVCVSMTPLGSPVVPEV